MSLIRPGQRGELPKRGNRAARRESAGAFGRARPERREAEKVGRNEPCPCRSGLKFKKCCRSRAGLLARGFERATEKHKETAMRPAYTDEDLTKYFPAPMDMKDLFDDIQRAPTAPTTRHLYVGGFMQGTGVGTYGIPCQAVLELARPHCSKGQVTHFEVIRWEARGKVVLFAHGELGKVLLCELTQ